MRFAPFTPRMGLILAHDLVVTVLAVLASFYIRFEDSFIAARSDLLSVLLPAIVLYASVVYLLIGLQKSKWRFTSLPELMKIAQAATVMAITLLALDYVLLAPNLYGTFFFGKITIVLYWFVQMFFLAGPRIAYRYFRYTRTLMHAREDAAQPTLLLGRAADADVLLRAIESGAVSRVRPVGILSPSRADRSQAIRGVPVLGEFDDLERVIADLGTRGRAVTRIILTPTALAPEAKPEALLMRARRMGLSASRLPSLDESGEAPRLAPVNVEDLLLRPSVKIDYKRLEHFVQGKSVIVTGGGGSIGSEICARLVTFGVGRLLVSEHSEPALYAVMEMLAGMNMPADINGRIADIRDRNRIFQLTREFKPDFVFHAAALKHVPILERDWEEGVRTNVFGSVNVADAAAAAGAAAMVMISTDKAIEPVSVLGATKRLAEMYCQALDADLRGKAAGDRPPMRLIAVRFGNVLGSTGSASTSFTRLSDLGLQFQSDGSIKADSTKLTAAMTNLPEMTKFFTATSANPTAKGFGVRLGAFASGLLSVSGTITTKQATLNASIKRNTTDQQTITDHATQVQARLLKQYTALDSKVAQLNALNSYVTQQITGWNNQKSN